MVFTKYFIALFVIVGLLSSCGDDLKSKEQGLVNNVADPLAPRYEVNLAEGIDFKKPGYPSFLAEVSGMSDREDWGRWTNGPVAKFRFKQHLPSKFTLEINAAAIGPNVGKPIIVRVGKIEKEFTVKESSAKTFTFGFDGIDGIDTLEIIPPKPFSPHDGDPKNPDTRLLGVAMSYLKIQ